MSFFSFSTGGSSASIKRLWDRKSKWHALFLMTDPLTSTPIFQRDNQWSLFRVCITHVVFQAVLVHILWCAIECIVGRQQLDKMSISQTASTFRSHNSFSYLDYTENKSLAVEGIHKSGNSNLLLCSCKS